MQEWKLVKIQYLSEGSVTSDNNGQTPSTAKYKKTFLNTVTGEVRDVTDLAGKRYKRDECLRLFYNTYSKYLFSQSHSFLAIVVNQREYPTITKFVHTITRKLKRKGVKRLGYFWVRDIGDKIFEKHFHIIIATTKINKDLFKELFYKKKHSHYEVQFLRTRTGMHKYIKKKELYAAKKQRSHGRSRLLLEKS